MVAAALICFGPALYRKLSKGGTAIGGR